MFKKSLNICVLITGMILHLSGQHPVYHKNETLLYNDIEKWDEVRNKTSNEMIDIFLQWNSIPDDKTFEKIKSSGINLYEYVPKFTYYAGVPVSITKQQLLDLNVIRLILPEPHLKIHPSLQYVSAEKRCWIHISPSANKDVCINQLKKGISENLIYSYIPEIHGIDILLNPTNIQIISSWNETKYIDAAPEDGESENDQAITNHRSNILYENWNNGLKLDGSGIHVMMSDDGDIGQHIDYKSRNDQLEATPSPAFVDHANHVAGTLIGAGNRDPRYRGVAPGAFLKVHTYTTDPSSGLALFDFPDAYINENVTITSTSQSDGCNAGYTSFAQLMDQQIQNHPSLMHVFSGGNSGNTNCGYGAGNSWGNITGGHKQAKNVIAVGNVIKEDLLVTNSSKGPAKDGRIKPECVATGTNITSTTDNPEENSYVMKSGTSHACPGVAGSLALLYQAYKDAHGDSLPTSDLMKAILLNGCDDLGNPAPDFKFGFGRINIKNAYQQLSQQTYHQDSIAQNGIKSYHLPIPENTKQVKVMIYWNDLPGSILSSVALVNDLDVKVIDPSSQIYSPWVLDHTPDPVLLNSVAQRETDTINNIEQITINNPVEGNWIMTVSGSALPFGFQSFSIVYFIIQENVDITYPHGGENWNPGETERIRWDASPDSIQLFSLSYSTDQGNSWQLISNSISPLTRHYDWVVPNMINGNMRIKIERGIAADISDTNFSIMPVCLNLSIDSVCDNLIKLNWDDVPDAEKYIIYELGNMYMDSITVSTQSEKWIQPTLPLNESWFSVRSIGTTQALSRRAYAINETGAMVNCYQSLENNESSIVHIHPNPTRDDINITFTSSATATLTLMDMTGRILLNKTSTDETNIVLDMKTLSNGIYVLNIQQNGLKQTYRIIKN